MNYAIMRTKKLKVGNAAASFRHNYREQETLNADAELTPTNDHNGTQNTEQAMQKMRDRLPEKYRKDAVVAIEYLFATSPEWAEKATQKQQKEFFDKSISWAVKKHGIENIVVASIHNDEKTPHMALYVVPLSNTNPEKPNRLCAKDFLGGRNKLSQMQTDFHEQVKHLGLERGIKGSTAKHEKIKRHYANINQGEAEPTIQISPADLVKRKRSVEVEIETKAGLFNIGKPKTKTVSEGRIESETGMAKRINKAINEQYAPVAAKARERDAAVKRAFTATQTAKRLEEASEALKILTKGLGKPELEELVKYSNHIRQNKTHNAEFQQMIDDHNDTEERYKQEQYKQDLAEDKPKIKGPKLGM